MVFRALDRLLDRKYDLGTTVLLSLGLSAAFSVIYTLCLEDYVKSLKGGQA